MKITDEINNTMYRTLHINQWLFPHMQWNHSLSWGLSFWDYKVSSSCWAKCSHRTHLNATFLVSIIVEGAMTTLQPTRSYTMEQHWYSSSQCIETWRLKMISKASSYMLSKNNTANLSSYLLFLVSMFSSSLLVLLSNFVDHFLAKEWHHGLWSTAH